MEPEPEPAAGGESDAVPVAEDSGELSPSESSLGSSRASPHFTPPTPSTPTVTPAATGTATPVRLLLLPAGSRCCWLRCRWLLALTVAWLTRGHVRGGLRAPAGCSRSQRRTPHWVSLVQGCSRHGRQDSTSMLSLSPYKSPPIKKISHPQLLQRLRLPQATPLPSHWYNQARQRRRRRQRRLQALCCIPRPGLPAGATATAEAAAAVRKLTPMVMVVRVAMLPLGTARPSRRRPQQQQRPRWRQLGPHRHSHIYTPLPRLRLQAAASSRSRPVRRWHLHRQQEQQQRQLPRRLRQLRLPLR